MKQVRTAYPEETTKRIEEKSSVVSLETNNKKKREQRANQILKRKSDAVMDKRVDRDYIGRYVRPLSYFQRIEELERRANTAANTESSSSSDEGEQDRNVETFDDSSQNESVLEAIETQKASEILTNNNERAVESVRLEAASPPNGSVVSDQPSYLNFGNLDSNAHSTAQARRNLGTSAAEFDVSMNQKANINKWMKQENWPHEKFVDVEIQHLRRQNWVNWANGFKLACQLAGDMTQEQLRMMFLGQGQQAVWQILGSGVGKLTFTQMWEKVDQFFASTSDPAVHAAAYRQMSQKQGESFMAFVTRLKKQSRLAEMTDEEEDREMRLALLERCNISKDLRVNLKMSPGLSNTQLQALGDTIEPSMPNGVLQILNERESSTKASVSVVEQKPKYREAFKRRLPQEFETGTSKRFAAERRCKSCGKGHSGQCTATKHNKICYNCGGRGHFARDCKPNEKERKPATDAGELVHQVNTDNKDW